MRPNPARLVRRRTALAIPLLVLCVGCRPASPDESADSTDAVGGPEMLLYLERTVEIAQDKLVRLAEAVPEDRYDWRPMPGVRSFGEVFIHVAADNWYGPALMEIEAPPEIGVTHESSSVQAYQERTLSKAQIVSELQASFDHLLAAARATASQVDRKTTLGSTTVTYGDLWVRLVTHMHEHLGQSIAYARANEIVPPWSG